MTDCIAGIFADSGGSALSLDCSTFKMTPRAINGRRVRVNDVELNVVVIGEGPEVLLVHGFPDDHTVWRNQIPALVNAGYRVIALDTRGCGESEVKPREGDYAIDKLVADLIALLDGLRLPVVLITGYLLHGIWDVLHEVHAFGGVSPFGVHELTELPLAYGAFCAAFDWCVAGYFYTRRGDWNAAWKARAR